MPKCFKIKNLNLFKNSKIKNYKIYNNHRAFSLIELMMVMAIIAIMSVVAYASLTSGRSQSWLKTAQREVASVIKLVQSYALQGKTQVDPSDSQTKTPCGYGFKFINDFTYIIYYNFPTSGTDYSNCDERNNQAGGRTWVPGDPNGSITAEQYTLNNSIVLSSSPTWSEIYFTVPHANRYGNAGIDYDSQNISRRTLTLSVSGVNKTIIMNAAGYLTESP